MRSKNFKNAETGKPKNYRVFVAQKHAGKIQIKKEVNVFAYHSNGKDKPATSVKMTLASGISRWTAYPKQ